MMSRKNIEMNIEKCSYSHDESTIRQCLVPECSSIFLEKSELAIKRHYRIAHDANVEDYESNEEILNIHNAEIHNNVEESTPQVHYSIEYLNDDAKDKFKSSNKKHDTVAETKAYKTVALDNYVAYCKQTNISKCLIRNCGREMSGRRSGNIKRHYQKVHNFIIVHDNQETMHSVNKDLITYYNNGTFGDNTFNEENEEDLSDISEYQSNTKINLEQYIDYDTLTNKSVCKAPFCKALLEGRKLFTVKRHYGLVHNYDIESNGSKVYNSKNLKICHASLQNTSIIPIENLVMYDINSKSYQCLFISCNEILDKHLPTLKRHYHLMHKIIIAKFVENIPHRFCKKRKASDKNYSLESISKEGEEYVDEDTSYVIKNEALSDDNLPCCSKKQNYLNEDVQPKSAKIEIAMTKLTFLKLCFDLIIESNLNIKLFDDEKLFKKLLFPFEQVFDCHVNSSVMECLMIAANNIVITDLTEKFASKIMCLELVLVKHDKKFYIILNVRFLSGQIVCNKVIGYFPITKAGVEVLPILEYLKKFNIDKEQVYMTTLLARLQDDEETSEIYNNICKHHPNIKNHPIYYIQNILRSFVQTHSVNIKSWQKNLNYECKLNTDMFNILKELENCVENLSETDVDLKPELKEAKLFFKTLRILRNFVEKLSEEQYVAGDFYRDWLCCELEMKGELKKNNNSFAGKLYEDLTECKNTLLQSSEIMAALYLDARINFLGSRLLSEDQKVKGKLHLCSIWEKYNKYVESAINTIDTLHIKGESNDDSNDDEYALLNQHINDIMPVKSNACIQDMITNCVSTKREPFSLDILKHWYSKGQDMKDIFELTKIAFTFSSSQYILIYLQKNFTVSYKDPDKFDKFLIKHNQIMLENHTDLIFKNLKKLRPVLATPGIEVFVLHIL